MQENENNSKNEFNLKNLLIVLFINFGTSLINLVLSHFCTKDLLIE